MYCHVLLVHVLKDEALLKVENAHSDVEAMH
jgi:hypothetical protein